MRIAVLFHELQERAEVERDHAISAVAEIWRQRGHDVRLLIGADEPWPADVAIVHVDLSVVPRRYGRRARAYPVALNDRILDIRKRVVSRNLIDTASTWDGPVIVRTNLNSAGLPEKRLLRRSRWRKLRCRLTGRTDPPIEYVKRYRVFDRLREIPADVLAQPGVIIEKFLPEIENGLYFIRRCFALGGSAISYRMGDSQPVVDGGDAANFTWIENNPEVLGIRKAFGLDYGVVDYTVHEGRINVFDVNKTPGRALPPTEEGRRDYDRILAHVASGIESLG